MTYVSVLWASIFVGKWRWSPLPSLPEAHPHLPFRLSLSVLTDTIVQFCIVRQFVILGLRFFFSGKQLQLPYFESKEITLLIIHRSQPRHLCWVHLWQDVEAESMTYLVMDSSVRLFFKSANWSSENIIHTLQLLHNNSRTTLFSFAILYDRQ